MPDRPARPPTRLQHLCWDGTDPVDSVKLAKGLATSFRCINLLDDSPAGEFGVLGSPRIFQPCGVAGTDRTDVLWLRGMFEFPRTFFNPVHNNAGSDLPAILQYSGHGIPGFMFAEGDVLIATSRAMTLTGFAPATGLAWAFNDEGWNNVSTKVLIFSSCRQLAGRPQQFLWSNRMRGAANRVHILLGYRNTAPVAATSAEINKSFIKNLAAGQTFINAWRGAHGGGLRQRWAALAFRSSVGDRMDHWVRDGSLPAEPAVDEDILYFDEDNRSGRVVTTPSPDFSMDMTFVSAVRPGVPRLVAGNTLPPWTVLWTGTVVNVGLKFRTDTFVNGDKVWLGVLQVRPDYFGPFDIETVIKFVNHTALISSRAVSVFGRLHDESKGWVADTYGDLYQFEINRAGMSFAALDSSFTSLTIPMVIGSQPNDHLPIFYMMVRLERGSREFGIPTDLDAARGIRIANQARLVDEPQFCVFHIARP
jgi:hypothetical protein